MQFRDNLSLVASDYLPSSIARTLPSPTRDDMIPANKKMLRFSEDIWRGK
jgi:hypothetical protein